jgi:hypothetical protein
VVLPVVIALATALLAASLVMLVQGLTARRAAEAARFAAAVRALAVQAGGVVTPMELARALGITAREADRILRGLVDDVTFTMGIDERQGVLQYWYPELLKQASVEETGTYSWARGASLRRPAGTGARASG